MNDLPNLNNGKQFEKIPIRARIDNPVDKKIKADIDARVKTQGIRHIESPLQLYDRLPKKNGFVNARQFLV